MDLNQKIICWKENEVELKPQRDIRSSHIIEEIYAINTASISIKEAGNLQSEVFNADYRAIDVEKFAKGLKHLNSKEQQLLKTTVDKHPELFSRGLGTLKIRLIQIELKPGAQPYHHHAYPIPKSLEATTKRK